MKGYSPLVILCQSDHVQANHGLLIGISDHIHCIHLLQQQASLPTSFYGRSHYTFKHAQSLERQAEPSYMCTAIVDVNRPRFAPVQR